MTEKHSRSKKQEARLAAEHRGRTQPASGALPGRKGDVSYTDTGWTIEAKYTDKKSFSVSRPMIEKIRKAANLNGDNWMIQIDFCSPRTKKPELQVAVVDYESLMLLVEEARKGRQDE